MSGIDGLHIRRAHRDDVAAIAALFAADPTGGHGDTSHESALADYEAAFAVIDASPNQVVYVAELDGWIVGTFQTIVITTMSGRGSVTMQIKAVQTREDMRGRGVGSAMMSYAIARARSKNARLVQLMSNNRREGAHRFYSRLGFVQSHTGFTMLL